MVDQNIDILVVGAGSGGIAFARRVKSLSPSTSVSVVENSRLGGTCVNVGCVPKKIMWWGASVSDILAHGAKHYGFSFKDLEFNWQHLKDRRDASVLRLNGIYKSNLSTDGINVIEGVARFEKKTDDGKYVLSIIDATQKVTKTVIASKVVIATGGKPQSSQLPGADLTISSDGFFELSKLPKSTAVIGAGYIAVELASMLRMLGSDVHLFYRGDFVLRKFDSMIQQKLDAELRCLGIHMHPHSVLQGYERVGLSNVKVLVGVGGEMDVSQPPEGFECVLEAIGRVPEIDKLNLTALGIQTNSQSHIIVSELQETTVSHIYALGDVCGKVELTPMAIAAGRRLADRLFDAKMKDAKADYDSVPTVIFSHPPIGTIGMTEIEAVKIYGKENISVYSGTSVNLYYNVFDVQPENKPRTYIKLICEGDKERIIGLHCIGMGVDEFLQGFGVAIKMGATKSDFDKCVAIHPSAAEEVVTLAPWGRR